MINHLERMSLVEFNNQAGIERLSRAIESANQLHMVNTDGVEPMDSVLEDRWSYCHQLRPAYLVWLWADTFYFSLVHLSHRLKSVLNFSQFLLFLRSHRTDNEENQVLNILHHVCVFQADTWKKTSATFSDWPRHFLLLLCNHWIDFEKTW